MKLSKEQRARELERQRVLRAQRRSAGTCLHCGEPRADGFRTCAKHRASGRVAVQAKRALVRPRSFDAYDREVDAAEELCACGEPMDECEECNG